MAGKGSKPRKVDRKKWDHSYDAIVWASMQEDATKKLHELDGAGSKKAAKTGGELVRIINKEVDGE